MRPSIPAPQTAGPTRGVVSLEVEILPPQTADQTRTTLPWEILLEITSKSMPPLWCCEISTLRRPSLAFSLAGRVHQYNHATISSSSPDSRHQNVKDPVYSNAQAEDAAEHRQPPNRYQNQRQQSCPKRPTRLRPSGAFVIG